MVNQLNCLKAGGLVLGVMGAVVAIINVIWAIAVYEEIPIANDSFVLNTFLGDAPDHIIRLCYVIISIIDVIAAVLLIAGILLKKRYFLMPWIVNSMVEIILNSVELSNHLIPAIVIVGIFGIVIYIWYCIVLLYNQMKAEEEANTGVQMAYVDESPSQLPPYNVLTIDK